MGDVGEGTAVDKGRGTLQSLDQVGLEGVLEQADALVEIERSLGPRPRNRA